MMTMAPIAGPPRMARWHAAEVLDAENAFGKLRAGAGLPRRVEVRERHFGKAPGLHVSCAVVSPLLFRVAALPEDDVAVETFAEPAFGAPAYEGPTVKVKFELQKECHFGQQFKVVGGDSQFGDWDPNAAVPLNWSQGHLWTAEVDVPEGKIFEYKYVLTGQKGEVEWQPGSNHVLETAAGAEPLVISEAWEETQLEPAAELEVPPAEPEVQSAESDVGDWETFSGDAEVRTPADALADAAASAAVGALNAGIKAATALEGGLDAVSSISESPSSETAESKAKETPTAIEIPVVDAALGATAEPAAPAEEVRGKSKRKKKTTSSDA